MYSHIPFFYIILIQHTAINMSHIHIFFYVLKHVYLYITHSLFYFKCKSRPCVVCVFFSVPLLFHDEYFFTLVAIQTTTNLI